MKSKNSKTIHFLQESLKGKRHQLVFLCLFQVILGGLNVSFAFLLQYVVRALEETNKDNFRISLFLLALVSLLLVLFQILYRYEREVAESDIENSLKSSFANKILNTDYQTIQQYHEEDLIHRLTSDTSVVANAMVSLLPSLLRMSIQFIAALILLAVLYPKFVLYLLPCLVILILITFFMRMRLKTLHRKVQEEEGKVKIFYSETLESLSILHTYAKEDVVSYLEQKKLEDHKKAKIQRIRFSNFCLICYLLVYYGTYLCGIGLSGMEILKGTMDLASLAGVAALLAEIQGPLANFTNLIPRYYGMIASAERIMIFSPSLTSQAPLSEKQIQEYYTHSFQSLSCENLSFSYVGKDQRRIPALENFSLTMKKGELLALKGQSGIGKSTLLKLILMLYQPQAGTIYLEDASGKHLLDSSYQKLFAHVPQESKLFKGTIEENITFFSKKVDQERLKEALTLSCCLDFLQDLKEGVKTQMKDKGSSLSLGQIQRISIARALYSSAPILLLDESTSSLDAKTEEQIVRNLSHLKNRTILFITHHQSVWSMASRVMEME